MAADTRDISRNTCACVTCWQFLVAFHLKLLLHIDTNRTSSYDVSKWIDSYVKMIRFKGISLQFINHLCKVFNIIYYRHILEHNILLKIDFINYFRYTASYLENNHFIFGFSLTISRNWFLFYTRLIHSYV